MAAIDLAELRRLAGGYRASQAIYAMVALGVPDTLAAGPASVEQVAASVAADPAAMSRLLRALGDLGILSREDDGRYRLTDASTSLRADDPDGLRAMILGWSALPVGYAAFGALHHAVRTGGNAFEHVYGQRFHDYLDHDSEAAQAYEAATESTVTAFDDAIRVGGFGRFPTVVDVGGGQGTFLEALLRQYPSARGVLLEVPRVAADARDRLRGRPEGIRIDIVAGDMFASIPPGGDAYVFLTVLRCFNDDECRQILARLWE